MTETPLTPTFQTVTLEADPAAPMDAATKQYVDATPGAGALQKAGGTMTGPLVLSGAPAAPLQPATKAYADAIQAGALLKAGDTMTGPLVLSGAPTAPLQPATKAYTDAAQAAAIAGAPVQSALGRVGNVTLTAPDVAAALGYTALDAAKVGAVNGVATLDAGGIVPVAQIPPQVGSGRAYLGTWNAATNTPTLANGVGTTGNFYIATTAGTALGATYGVGDQVAYNGTTWQRVAAFTGYGTMSTQNAAAVAITGGSVTGQTVVDSTTVSIAAGNCTITEVVDGRNDTYFTDSLGFVGAMLAQNGQFTVSGLAVNTPLNLSALIATTATLGSATATTLTTPLLGVGQASITEVADGDNSIIFADPFGYVGGVISSTGDLIFGTVRTTNLIASGSVSTPALNVASVLAEAEIADSRSDILYADPFGFVGFGIKQDGTLIGALTSSGGGGGGLVGSYAVAELEARDGRALAGSMVARSRTNTTTTVPLWTYAHVITYGQSLSIGAAGNPALSTVQKFDSLSFGTRSLPSVTPGPTFTPNGDSLFHPLVAVTADTPGHGAVNTLRELQLAWRALVADAARRLVLNDAGIGSRTIEQLSKGASPDLYSGILDLVNQSKAAATTAGGTYGVAAVLYIQGEANYITATLTQAAYQAALLTLRSNLAADAVALTGQSRPPALFITQTSSQWDHSGDICAIGNAQIGATLADPMIYLTGPNYMTPRQSDGHLTNDGYRWLGSKAGHVMHKVLDRREGWLPFYATGAFLRGASILLEFNVPEPPIAIASHYVTTVLTAPFADLGFSAGDTSGPIAITAVTLFRSTILLTLFRAPGASPWVQYADATLHNGSGNICDSDPTVSLDLSTLTGAPYPMQNWLLAFRMIPTIDL